MIPEEWAVSSFGDVFSITAGGDVDPKRSQSFQDEIHCYPIYSNALTNCGLYGYCSYADHPADSLTITARGMVGAANFRDHAYTAIGRVLVLQPKNDIAGIYFAEVVNSRVKFANESTGVPQLTAPQISKYRLPVPPLPEQRAIAAALSDVDALLAKLDQFIAKKRDLKQATMQQLLTGQTRLPGFSGEWKTLPISEIANVKTGPFGSSLHESDYVQDGTPIITVEHLGEFGVTCQNLPLVSDEDYRRLQAYSLEVGDIVFSRVGSVDRNALIRKHEEGWLFSGRLLRVRPNKRRVFSPYLSYQFHTEAFRNSVLEVAVGQTMASLNTKILKDLAVPLPAIEEQTAIATVLSDMDTELAALEARRDKTRALKQGMMQELLTGRIRLV